MRSKAELRMISLEQAKKLVELLENDKQQDADSLVRSIYEDNFSLQDNPMLQEIGSLTRDLHDLSLIHI